MANPYATWAKDVRRTAQQAWTVARSNLAAVGLDYVTSALETIMDLDAADGKLLSTVDLGFGLFGDESDGAVANIADQDYDATTVAQSGTVSLTSNRIIRASGVVTLSQTITVGKQDGQARGSFPTTHGSPGIDVGAILEAIGTKGIPVPIRPGADGTGLCGGIVQIVADDDVAIGGAIDALGTNAASDGGGGGGLVVIASSGTISGSSAIDVSASGAHATGAARGGAGSYSGEPGGHAGYGGGGGGAGEQGYGQGGGGGGLRAGQVGGVGTTNGGGGGGGSLDTIGSAGGGSAGGDGGDGDDILANYTCERVPEIGGRLVVAKSSDGGTGAGAGGIGGTNGGGGGGGGRTGAGGAATALSGSGGGGSGDNAGGGGYSGGAGATGGPEIYTLSSHSVYAGLPGGQGGGGGGGHSGGSSSPGAGGAAAAGVTAFVAGHGAGDGGVGVAGATASGANGGAGGSGGNGGGAAGLVILIGTSITYSGTVTGRLIKISGTDAYKFLRGIFSN